MGAFDAALDAAALDAKKGTTGTGLFDAALDAEANAGRAALQQSLNLATRSNPVKAGGIQSLADKTSLPVPVVENNEAQIAAQQRAVEIYRAVQASPILARQLTDVNFAKIAQDDVENLGMIERVTRTQLGASLKAGTYSLIGTGAKLLDAVLPTLSEQDAAVLYKNEPEKFKAFQASPANFLARFTRAMQQASEHTMANINPQAQAEYGSLKYATTNPREAAYLSPIKIASDALQSLPTTLALAVSMYLTKGVAARVEAESLEAGMTPELARRAAMRAAGETMAKLGATTEGAAGYAQQAMQTREQADKVKDEDLATSPAYQKLIADGYAPEVARAAVSAQAAERAGTAGGLVDAVTNFVGGKVLGRVIGEGGKLAPRVAKGAATEAVTEAVQSGGEQIGQNAAVQAFLNPRQELLDNVAESIAQGFVVGGAMGGSFSAVLGRNNQAEQAKADGEALKQLLAAAAASAVRERSPTTFTQFVAQATADAPVSAVYVNAATFAQGAAEAGIDIRQAMPETAAVIEDAIATNSDVRIPISELATVLPGTALEQAIIPEFRTSPDGPTLREASDAKWVADTKAQTEKILAEQEFTDSWKQSAKTVENELLAQLNKIKRFTEDVNKAYAGLMAAFYATQSHRLGITPEQMYVRYPLRVEAVGLKGARVMDQPGVPPSAIVRKIGDKYAVVQNPNTGRETHVYYATEAAARAAAERTGKEASRSAGPTGAFGAENRAQSVQPEGGQQYAELGLTLQRVVDRRAADSIASAADALQRQADGTLKQIPERAGFCFKIAAEASAAGLGDMVIGETGDGAGGRIWHAVVQRDGAIYDPTFGQWFEPGVYEALGFDARKVLLPDEVRAFIQTSGGFAPDARNQGLIAGAAYEQPAQTGARGRISFADNIQEQASVITLLKKADLSTFLHESGHFYLEVLTDMANQPDAPAEIVADMQHLLKWFGLRDMDQWNSLTTDEKRPYHEQFARGFEAYLFEGKSPSIELQSLFGRFRAWLISVYKQFFARDSAYASAEIGKALNVELSDEVRGVMDRLLATNEQIIAAEEQHNMAPLFETKPDGMSDAAWLDYQARPGGATQAAVDQLQTRSLRDLQWAQNAHARVLRDLQRKAAGLRREMRIGARREVLSEPIYQAWQYLTGKLEISDKPKKAAPTDTVDPSVDTLFTAIAKLGGIDRAEAIRRWGVDIADAKQLRGEGKHKIVLRAKGGKDIDTMLEALGELGYVDLDVNGKADERQLEDKFGEERIGNTQYSNAADYATIHAERLGPASEAETVDIENEPAGKLDTNVLKARYGAEDTAAWRKLTDLGMTSATQGLHPDTVAELFGFSSGDELVQKLLATDPPRIAIDGLTDQRMLERYGDLADPAAMNKAANEAVHNDLRLRVLATEEHILSKALGNKRLLAEAAKSFAAAAVSRQRVRDLRPDRYVAAAARAGREAARAHLAGDIAAAAAQKRNQVVNAYAAKAAYEAITEVDKKVASLRRVLVGSGEDIAKTRDVDVVMAARAVLADYGIGTKGEAAVAYLEKVKTYDSAMYEVLRERVDALASNAKPYRDLTLDEFRALADEIGSMMHLARRSRQMEVDGDLLDRKEVQAKIRDRLLEIGVPDRVPGEGQAVTPAERRLAMLRTLGAAMRRVESWVGLKDGTAAVGPFRRYVWQPVKDAADRYRTEKAVYLKQYRTLLEAIAPTLPAHRIYAPELGYTFGYSRGGSGVAEILHAILHTGNASNKRKLLLGRRWAVEQADGTLDTSRWDVFINRMTAEGQITKAHYDFAQGVWDMFEKTKPLAQKTHRDVFGYYFAEVTAESFDTPFGRYSGGYVPALADPEVVTDAKTRALMEEENSALAFAFPATSRGFTKGRVEYNRPLLLDLRVVSQHLDKVLLFSHLEQPIRDVRRVLTAKEVATPLSRIDPAAFDGLLTPWLNRAARQQVETPIAGSGGLMRFFSAARSRAGMAAMFANVSNTVQQITGMSTAAVKVRPRYLLAAVADFVKSPREFARTVAEASPYMNTRMENEVAQMSGAINDLLLNPSTFEKVQAWTAKHAYFLQAAVDNVLSPIVWTGAYNQALEQGVSERDAKRLADGVVRETQGSTQPEEVSRIETGNAFARMFTHFASYFNAQANMLGTEFAKVAQDVGLRKGAGRAFYILLFGFLGPAWVSEFIAQAFRGGPDDEDKDGSYIDDWLAAVFGFGTLRYGTAMVPVAGQIVNAAVNTVSEKPYDDRISTAPAISMIESAVRAPHSVYAAIWEDGKPGKAIKDVATLVSLVLGVPATAVARPASYAADVAASRVHPTGPVDAVRGAVTGAASPESKK